MMKTDLYCIQQIETIENTINCLPEIAKDTFPYLSREIFSVTKKQGLKVPTKLAYKSIMVHFGISIKQLDNDIDKWIKKYEDFLFDVPSAWESIVHIKMEPYTGNYPMNRLNYYWYKQFKPKSTDLFWSFEGDPTTWKE